MQARLAAFAGLEARLESIPCVRACSPDYVGLKRFAFAMRYSSGWH